MLQISIYSTMAAIAIVASSDWIDFARGAPSSLVDRPNYSNVTPSPSLVPFTFGETKRSTIPSASPTAISTPRITSTTSIPTTAAAAMSVAALQSSGLPSVVSTTPSDVPSLPPSASPRPTSTSSSGQSVSPSQSTSPTLPLQSALPSVAKASNAPTLQPTSQCHDDSAYRSPLNSLECYHHTGTDCFAWRFLGLTADQVHDLIVSCPVSCQMNCGSLLEFATNRTFQLRQVVDTFLSPESTAAMEHASAHYLTDYVLSKHVDSKFLLHRVELLSQRISERFTGRRRILQRLGSRRRAMQEESVQNVVDLDVTVAFRGFVLELSLATIELYVLEGIQSAGFISALQYTNDPAFQEVNVSLDVDDGRIDLSPESEPDTNETIGEPTRVIVLVLTLILLGAVAVAVLLYAKLRRIDSMAAAAAQPDIIDLDSQVVSPAVSTRSGLANVLSCDSFLRCISTQASPKSFVHEDSSTEHSSVMASEFESGRDSPSRESRASGTVEHPLTTSTADEHPLISSTADEHPLITSTTDEHQFTTSSDDEHPLTGVIPQMIVYDCIDDDENIKKEVDKVDRPQCVVPSRHMAATAQFRAALQDHSREAIDESTFVGIRNFEASKTDFAFDDTCFAGAPHHASGNSVDAIDSRRNHQTNTDSKGPSYQVISSIELNPTLDEDGAVSDATTVRIGAGGRSTPELSLSVSFKGGTDAHENLPRTRRKSSAHMRRSRSSDRITDKDRRDMLPFESFRKEKDARSERKGAASDEDPKKMFQVPASYHRLSFSRSSIRSTTSSPVPPLSPPPSPPAIRSSTSMTTILMRPIGTPPRQARKAYQ